MTTKEEQLDMPLFTFQRNVKCCANCDRWSKAPNQPKFHRLCAWSVKHNCWEYVHAISVCDHYESIDDVDRDDNLVGTNMSEEWKRGKYG